MKKIIIISAVVFLGFSSISFASSWSEIFTSKISIASDEVKVIKVVDGTAVCYVSLIKNSGVLSSSISCLGEDKFGSGKADILLGQSVSGPVVIKKAPCRHNCSLKTTNK